MRINTEAVEAGINWPDQELATLHGQLKDQQGQLDALLLSDITPADLVIGGGLVANYAYRNGGYTTVGGPNSGASATVERWATDSMYTVRISKTCNDAGAHPQAKGLARQALAGNDESLLARWRTRKVAKLVGATSLTTVELFPAGEVDDLAIRQMRTSDEPLHKVQLESATFFPFRRNWVIAAANSSARNPNSMLTCSMQAEPTDWQSSQNAHVPPTQPELINRTQSLVDREIAVLGGASADVQTALGVLLEGNRIRPSIPQHDVPRPCGIRL